MAPAIPHRDRERAEPHGLAQGRGEFRDAGGGLVEPLQHRTGDRLGRRGGRRSGEQAARGRSTPSPQAGEGTNACDSVPLSRLRGRDREGAPRISHASDRGFPAPPRCRAARCAPAPRRSPSARRLPARPVRWRNSARVSPSTRSFSMQATGLALLVQPANPGERRLRICRGHATVSSGAGRRSRAGRSRTGRRGSTIGRLGGRAAAQREHDLAQHRFEADRRLGSA